MSPRVCCFLFITLVAQVCAAAEPPTKEGPPTSTPLRHEAIKGFKYQPPPSLETSPLLVSTANGAAAPVVMDVYTVRGLADRTFRDLTDSFAQQDRLKSPALVKVNLTKKLQLELILPPKFDADGAGFPRINVEILRLRW